MALAIAIADRVTVRDVVSYAKRRARGKLKKLRGPRAKSRKSRQQEIDAERANPANGPPPLGVAVSDGVETKDAFGRR